MDLATIQKLSGKREVVVGIGGSCGKIAFSVQAAERQGFARVTAFRKASELVSALENADVDAIVRGTLSANETLTVLKKRFHLTNTMRAALMLSPDGRILLLMPVGIDEGKTFKERCGLLELGIGFVRRFGARPCVGVLSAGHSEDVNRDKSVKESVAAGERLAELFKRKGFDSAHYGISIEEAVKHCNIVALPDGVTGNYVFRSLYYLGGWESIGAPLLNFDKVYVDTTRGKRDYVCSIALAGALANLGMNDAMMRG